MLLIKYDNMQINYQKFIKSVVLIMRLIYLCSYDNTEPDLEVPLIKK